MTGLRRRDRRRRTPAGAADRRAHRAARHPARARARPPPGRHRRRHHHEARPHASPPCVARCEQAGGSSDALYVERASMPEQRWLPVADVDPDDGAVLLAHRRARRLAARRAARGRYEHGLAETEPGVETGAGRAARRRPRPRARRLADPRGRGGARRGRARRRLRAVRQPGPAARRACTRHASGNTVEVDRARLALDLALAGERVAVVSGGDAGVFGMASAVFEAAPATRRYADVPVRVLPGVSAVQAVAARAGAPIGGGLRGDEPLGPAQAVGGHRAAAARDRRGRPGARRSTTRRRGRGPRRSPTCSRILLEHGSRHRRRGRPRRRPAGEESRR